MTTEPPSIVRLDPAELLSRDRALAERAMNRLSVAEQVRTVLATEPARREALLLLASQAQRVTGQLPPEEFWLTVAAMGVNDAAALIGLASPEQIQCCCDLACWEGAVFQPREMVLWWRVLLACGEAKVAEWWRTADPDFLVFVVKRFAAVYMRAGDEDVGAAIPWPREEPPQTFDRLYYFQCTEDVDPFLRPCLETLARVDLDRLRHLFDAVLGATITEQEEAAYAARGRRLAELGFPPWEEAISVYARLRPEQWEPLRRVARPRMEGAVAPTFPLRQMTEATPFVTKLVSALDAAEAAQFALELARVANRVAVADGHAITPEAVCVAARKAIGYVNIGLELVARGESAAGLAAIREFWAVTLFQIGFSAVAELRARTRARWPRIAPTPQAVPDDPEAAIPYERVRAATWQWPKYYCGVEAPDGIVHRDFASVNELAAVESALLALAP